MTKHGVLPKVFLAWLDNSTVVRDGKTFLRFVKDGQHVEIAIDDGDINANIQFACKTLDDNSPAGRNRLDLMAEMGRHIFECPNAQ